LLQVLVDLTLRRMKEHLMRRLEQAEGQFTFKPHSVPLDDTAANVDTVESITSSKPINPLPFLLSIANRTGK
jgi:hypothetical protein